MNQTAVKILPCNKTIQFTHFVTLRYLEANQRKIPVYDIESLDGLN